MTRRVLDYGERSVLVECADTADAVGLAAALRAEDAEFSELVAEAIPGARTVLVRLHRSPTARERDEVGGWPAKEAAPDGDLIEIEVRYDGQDLAEVAQMLGIEPDEVIARHTGQTWTVGFCGFTPGFGYLMGERDDLRVPRRASPRTQVPAGSVGLADEWSGIYPRSAPGGWQLIGTTARSTWDLGHRPPALLRPGVRVRFRAARGAR